MSFTAEHIPVLEKHQHHWHGLRDIGVMVNLDGDTITDLQRVFNEAVGPQQFTRWCKDCIADLVRLVYQHFDAWKQEQQQQSSAAPAGDPPKQKPKQVRQTKTAEDGK